MSGREVCPDDVYGQQEIHINGDVTLAFQNYLYLTEVGWFITPVPSRPLGSCSLSSVLQDLSLFREGRGAELVYGVADYWVSRVKWNPEDQKYHLLGKSVITKRAFLPVSPNQTQIIIYLSPSGVMPPDEFYRNVNNSVYTNAVAKFRFEFSHCFSL